MTSIIIMTLFGLWMFTMAMFFVACKQRDEANRIRRLYKDDLDDVRFERDLAHRRLEALRDSKDLDV